MISKSSAIVCAIYIAAIDVRYCTLFSFLEMYEDAFTSHKHLFEMKSVLQNAVRAL